MTRTEIEKALDTGLLWAAMANGRYWRLRRNGATKTWKRDAARFEIPVKAGLRACARLTPDSVITPEPDGSGRFIVERV